MRIVHHQGHVGERNGVVNKRFVGLEIFPQDDKRLLVEE